MKHVKRLDWIPVLCLVVAAVGAFALTTNPEVNSLGVKVGAIGVGIACFLLGFEYGAKAE